MSTPDRSDGRDEANLRRIYQTIDMIILHNRNFGSYVTHETKHFIYFYLGQIAVLLFKSG